MGAISEAPLHRSPVCFGVCAEFMVRPAGRLADGHANAVCVDRLRRELVMDVFDLDEAVIDHYEVFARAFTNIHSRELNAKVDELYATKRFWLEPLIQLNPHYSDGGSIQDFIDAGDLEPGCAEVFRDPLGNRWRQEQNA